MKIDISNLDKAVVLAALVNAAKHVKILEFLRWSMPYHVEDARLRLLGRDGAYIDYIQDKSIKVDLTGDQFDSQNYDRDNGDGAAAAAIAKLREKS